MTRTHPCARRLQNYFLAPLAFFKQDITESACARSCFIFLALRAKRFRKTNCVEMCGEYKSNSGSGEFETSLGLELDSNSISAPVQLEKKKVQAEFNSRPSTSLTPNSVLFRVQLLRQSPQSYRFYHHSILPFLSSIIYTYH